MFIVYFLVLFKMISSLTMLIENCAAYCWW